MENRKDKRMKLQLTEQQQEYLKQRTQEQRFQTVNEYIRYCLFVEPPLKEMMSAHTRRTHALFIEILEEVKKHE